MYCREHPHPGSRRRNYNLSKQLKIFLLPVFLLALVMLAKSMTMAPPPLLLGLVILLFVVFFCFIQQDVAAVVLILSMILSPEIFLSDMRLRQASIRLDDIVLITFFFSWLFKMSYTKHLSLIKFTPLNKPLLTYIFVAIFCSWYAYITKGALNPASVALHIIKYLEYFMIYFMFTNITTTKKQITLYMKTLFVGAIIVSIFGFYQIFTGVPRITAPFEGAAGEANTFGGYLLVILGQTWVAMLLSKKSKHTIIALIASILIIILILYTYSRTTYIALIAFLMFSFLIASQKQKVVLFISSAILILFIPWIIPQKVVERVVNPFSGKTETVMPGIQVNPRDSLYNRVQSMEISMMIWKMDTVFGRGVTGVGIVDIQYFRVIGEMGVIGLIVFFWILFSIFGAVKKTRNYLTLYDQEYALQYNIIVAGFLCTYIGLLVHALGTNTFIIIRIMEPFWFLVAMVVKIPEVLEKDTSEPEAVEKYLPKGLYGKSY